jgi:hypothetical protein
VNQLRKRLTYANVMSSIAVFLVLGGATAFAASQLGKNSVGSKQLKKNSVTKVKIKKGAVSGDKLANGAVTESKLGGGAVTNAKLGDNSVSTAKIQNGAVNGDKIADGSLSGADINAGSTPFSQVMARLRNPGPVNMQAGGATLVGTYNQGPSEDDNFFAGVDVTFQASCAAPRSALAYLLLNNPTPSPENILGIGQVTDSIGGTLTKRLDVGTFPGIGSGLQRMGSGATQSHAFFLYTAASCNSGTGVAGTNLGVDIVGSK